jgi:hypothetical protein
MISVSDTSSIVQSFKITKFKTSFLKNNYDFCFEFLKNRLNVLKV